jgi:selenocysteine lyase/cysteine desulfurase
VTSYKRLSRALAAAPERLHFAAHSHHLWPDATREAHIAAWDDAVRLADHKWDRIFGEIWPRAQRGVAKELALPSPETVVFAPSTHELAVRMASAFPKRPIRVLTSDAEFHSFRRQSARWAEAGEAALTIVPAEPFADFPERFLAAAKTGEHDLI